MSLPQITIPAVNIPFDIPTLLHPALAHFAIAIPVLVVIAEICNLFIKGKGIKIMSSLFMFLLIVIFFGMYLTGVHDGKVAIDNGFGAVGELKEHKLLGIYIFYASIFVFVLKLISLAVSKTGFKVFYILVLIGFLAGILHQGKEGGELVYEHGANVQMQKDDFDDDEDEEATPTVKEQKHESVEKKAEATEKVEKAEKKEETKAPAAEAKKEVSKDEHKAVEESKKEAEKAVEETKEEAKTQVHEKVEKATEKIKEEVNKAVETVKEVTDLNKTEH